MSFNRNHLAISRGRRPLPLVMESSACNDSRYNLSGQQGQGPVSEVQISHSEDNK